MMIEQNVLRRPMKLALAVLCAALFAVHGAVPNACADDVSAMLPPIAKDAMYFPDREKRLNRQGRVLVELRVSKAGKAVDANVVSQEPADFVDSRWVAEQLKSVTFNVPPDWSGSGGEDRVFKLSLVYLLSPCASCDVVKHFDVVNTLTITGSAIPVARKR